MRKYLKAEANDPLWTLDAEDRTPGNIFLKDLDKGLQQNWPGLAKDSLGVRFRNRKFNRVQWKEFPQPTQFNTTTGTYTQSDRVSADGSRFDTVDIEIASVQFPTNKAVINGVRIMDMHNRRAVVSIAPRAQAGNYDMTFTMQPFDLENPDSGTGNYTYGTDAYLRKKQVTTQHVSTVDDQFSFKVTYHRQRNYGGPVGVADQNLLGGWSHFAGITNLDFGPNQTAQAGSATTSYFNLGDLNAFCLNTGRVTDRMLKVHLEPFWKHEQERAANSSINPDYDLIQGTMAYLMGMSYYQRVSRSFETLKDTFKVHAVSMRAHGFAQLGAELNGTRDPIMVTVPNQAAKRPNLVYPVVDMNFSRTAWAGYGDLRPDAGGQGMITGADFMTNLFIAEISALEHHTIKQYIKVEDSDAVSTVDLIHRVQQDGNVNTNVVELTADNYVTEKTKTYSFESQTKTLQNWAPSLWTSVEAAFAGWDKNLARVFITPGPVAGAAGQWKGMGALIIGKSQAGALIGRINGGASNWLFGGSNTYSSSNLSFGNSTISISSGGTLSFSPQPAYTPSYGFLSDSWSMSSTPSVASLLGSSGGFLSSSSSWYYDVYSTPSGSLGSQFLSNVSTGMLLGNTSSTLTFGDYYGSSGYGGFVGDPVNSITGELYADELDLTLPGPIPLQIRRNYSSQSRAYGHFGYGWKMSYFPYMVPVDGTDKLQVAELDGSVIVYARNTANLAQEEWTVRAQDNPHLTNGDGLELGSVRNLFRNRILRTSPGGVVTYTLYGADGSTRVYEKRSYPVFGASPAISRERPYLKRWTDSAGNYLDFKFFGDGVSGDPWYVATSNSSYGELARVQASNGNYYGFKYDVYGHIVEIYTGDGRRISYRYDGSGDLVEVTLPDNAWVRYDYLHEQSKVGSTSNTAWSSTHLIKKEIRPGGRTVESDYQLYVQGDLDLEGNAIGAGSDKIGKTSHLRRVVQQRATVGKHSGGNNQALPAAESYEAVRNATYSYFNSEDANGMTTGRTEILDAYNRKTIYYYTNNRLTKVFDPVSTVTNAATGTGTNPKMEQEWYTALDVTNGVPGAFAGALKSLQNRGGVRTEFGYNSGGDATEIRVKGDLDGDGVSTDVAVTTAIYNSLHLPELITHPNPTTGLATGRRTRYYYQDAARPYAVTRVENQDASGTVLKASTTSYQDAFSNPSNQAQVPFCKGMVYTTKMAEGTAEEAVTVYQQDARGFITKRTGYSGQVDQTNYPDLVIEYSHNLRGELVEERVMDGVVAKKVNRYAYDDMGRRLWVENLNESGTQLGWNYTYYNLTGEVEWTDGSKTNPEDYTYTRYDGAGRKVEQVSWRSRAKADGTGVEAVPGVEQYATTKYFYNLFGDLIKIMDPRGHTGKAGYDGIGRKILTEAYQGDWQNGGTLLATETTAYDDALLKVTQTDSRGGVTQKFFTSDARPRRQINPDGTELEWRYYLDGRIKREPVSEHQYHEYAYNDATRTTTKTLKNASAQTQGSEVTTADRRGNVVSSTNFVGHVTTSTFDKLDRAMTTVLPASGATSAAQSTTVSYDAAGLKNKAVSSLGESTETICDALGRKVSVTVRNAANTIITQSVSTYSLDSHQVTSTTGSGGEQLTQSTWTDTAGRTVLVKNADGTYARTEYDAAGNAAAVTDESGQTTKTSYDGMNRMALTLLPDGAATQYVYTNLGGGGQKVERLMPQGLKEVATLDAAGRPAESYLEGSGGVQSRRYHTYQFYTAGKEKGMLKQFTDPRGLVHTSTYDDWQRILATTVGTVGSPTYVKREMLAYDLRGQVTHVKETTAAGVTEILRAYDGQGHLEYEKTKLDGVVVSHLTNTYDGSGRRNGLARGGDVSALGSGAGGSWGFGYRADGLLAQVTLGGGTFNYTYGDSGLLKTRSNPFRTYTVPGSGGRDNRGRVLAAQTRLTGRSVDVVAEAISWTSDSRQASYAATRLTANDGTGTATWQDARNYQYSAQRRQLISESWVPGDGQSARTQLHEHDYGQPGGLGIYTGRETPAPSGSTGSQLFLVNDAGMEGGAGLNALGRVTREVSGFETLGLTAQGTAKGAKNVELVVNTKSELSEVQHAAATRFTSGAWSRQMWMPAGGYNLLAKGNHPSGLFSAQANATFNLGVRHFGVENLFDDDGNVTQRHIAGGFAQNGRSQSLTWDGFGRLVKVVQEEFGGFGYEWTAVYDGFGRRLQTKYVPKRGNLYQSTAQVTERSWYDPLVEFLEVGIEVIRGSGGAAVRERWWKVHGPDLSGGYGGLVGMGGLEALVNEANAQAVGTVDDAYGHIVGFARAATLSAAAGGTLTFEWNDARFGGYGPLSGSWSPSIPDGLSVWRAFGWRGKRQDVTGFYHMGARYYESASGRFLSTDPMGHEASMSLYDYAGGDPINFVDPQGRSAINIWSSPVLGTSYGIYSESWNSGGSSSVGSAQSAVPPAAQPKTGFFSGLWGGTKDLAVGFWEGAETIGHTLGYAAVTVFDNDLAEDLYGTGYHRMAGFTSEVGYQLTSVYDRDLADDIYGSTRNGFADTISNYGFDVYEGNRNVGADIQFVLKEASGGQDASWEYRAGYVIPAIVSAIVERKMHTGGGLPGYCFAPGTPVLMGDGSTRPVETIREGDWIMADDPEDERAAAPQRVLALHQNWSDHLYEVRVDKDQDGLPDGRLKATGGHPFWTKNRGWIKVCNLQPNDILADASGGDSRVLDTKIEERISATYNLSVANIHTFFVMAGKVPVLVHNTNPGPRTYIIYQAPIPGTNLIYTGRASMPGLVSGREVLEYRFGGGHHRGLDFNSADVVAHVQSTIGRGSIEYQAIRGAEQIWYDRAVLNEQAVRQIAPISASNGMRDDYLRAAQTLNQSGSLDLPCPRR
ncbi:RHS repeat-associated core domain-containing protein [Verrucomicrobium sp. BvORR106]|uniref:RHS repeat-associated core domain-containing protein n=1 Tax=Verrucomicrobium sp. BvORR106 TaxID=1403819 RepID=UPI002240EF3C|nr:RHS repeat-associated core domain-containing protein [Verrucomicrobium sp. BvORR106]